MAKITKLKELDVKLTRKNFYVGNYGKPDEYYIDPQTERMDKRGNILDIPLVTLIAENETYFFYICPFCQEIHIESKRIVNVSNKIGKTNCEYKKSIYLNVQYNHDKELLAFEKVLDNKLEKEWKFMENFEKTNSH